MAGAPRIFMLLIASNASSGVDTFSQVTVWLPSALADDARLAAQHVTWRTAQLELGLAEQSRGGLTEEAAGQ